MGTASGLKIYVPAGTGDTYKAGWPKYASKIEERAPIVVANGTCGTNVSWSLTDNGVLTISGSGAMKNYYSSSLAPWYFYRNDITSVVIGNGVTTLGTYAFMGCTNLETVTFAEGSQLTTIASHTFYNCSSLSTIVLPNSVTGIGEYAFWQCTSLTTFTIPSSVPTIGSSAFYYSGLTSIDIPASVTSISDEAFGWYPNLTSINVYVANTKFASEDGVLFNKAKKTLIVYPMAKSATSYSIPSSVVTIKEEAFAGCSNLTFIVIPNSVTTINHDAFWGCSGLTSIDIPGSVTTIDFCTFKNCTSLTSVDFHSGLTTIKFSAFENCTALTTFTIPESVTGIGEKAFKNTGWYNNQADGLLYKDNWLLDNKGSQPTGNITILEGTKGMASNIFYKNTGLTSVSIPGSLTKIISKAFYECTNLSSVTIGSGVTIIGESAFYHCSGLTSIDIPGSVTAINSQAFYWCANLESLTIGNGVRSIGQNAFDACTSLKSVILPSSIRSIGKQAFYYCPAMTSLTLNSNPSIAADAFEDTPATVTMNLTGGEGATREYWTTFYNQYHNFEATSGTQIFKAALSGTNLTLTELGDDQDEDKIITKNKAVILKSTASPISLTLTTTKSSNDFNIEVGKTGLTGVSSADGQTANGTHFVLNKGTNGVGFYRMTSGKVIGVGKAYLTYSGALAREFFGFDDEVTSIDAIHNSQCIMHNEVYDLQGRRMAQPTKGLYIINGKKTVIE